MMRMLLHIKQRYQVLVILSFETEKKISLGQRKIGSKSSIWIALSARKNNPKKKPLAMLIPLK